MSKPIKLDWDQLEEAFNNKNDELVYYLDLVSGHVHLEGEDEDQEDEEAFDTSLTSPVQARRNDPMRAFITPPDTKIKVVWLEAFWKSGGFDAEIVEGLEKAVVGDDPGPAIREVLNANPDVRDAWYVYRSDRIREMIAAWLTEIKVQPTDPPPWE